MAFFFGKKRKESDRKKRLEEIMELAIEHAPKIRELLREPDRAQMINPMDSGAVIGQQTTGNLIGRMYDFYDNMGTGGVFERNNGYIGRPDMPNGYTYVQNNDGFNQITVSPAGSGADTRIVATPKSIMEELEIIPVDFLLENLDEKIATLKDKENLSNQRYAKEQISELCKRLENRKRYKEFEDFFKSLPVTTDTAIQKLLDKYKLVFKSSELFIPSFPKEAIDIMKEYTRVCKEISGLDPVFYVIAEAEDFKDKVKKNDPILLAQSPFGFTWYVLGAWDEEMLLLSEL